MNTKENSEKVNKKMKRSRNVNAEINKWREKKRQIKTKKKKIQEYDGKETVKDFWMIKEVWKKEDKKKIIKWKRGEVEKIDRISEKDTMIKVGMIKKKKNWGRKRQKETKKKQE